MSLEDGLVDVAMGLMSCAPAYVALVAEAQVDAGVRRGLAGGTGPGAGGRDARRHRGAAAAQRGYDTLAVRREVASPGGLTARGLSELERGGIRAAFSDALDAVLVEDAEPRQLMSRAAGSEIVMLAIARTDVAEYLSTVIYVYTLLIIVYIVIQLLLAVGRATALLARQRHLLGFLRDVCEPFLRVFRRLLPSFGGFDFSPILAIIALGIVNRVRGRRPHPRLTRACTRASSHGAPPRARRAARVAAGARRAGRA